ncbi:Gfo/Idh/MocA family oxidoreductase [Halobacillus locisalis]|uniref:Gfo/Idh/MocA family oxidoreductase n=1 Tax=Halobacillus locisalis TaxID=220753 RepID=A0A838CT78_9BACI|nr:Gfo/Idh/MocA family oxidoreductase [Halobacillus locisalis]MBA2175029.1 Gfo/Idh/MocA family oxidoreductase [Halobacillus locisalis]
MIRFGVIGTNSITEKFIQAGKQHDAFQLIGVYSRTEKRAREFASEHGADLTFTSIEEMAKSDRIDAVYIASPNSFHAEQANVCMTHGKHVLCEKPMASNQQEVDSMIETAQTHGVTLMEAVKSTFIPGFALIQEHLHKIGPVRRYVGNFCKYSSRYDAYKEGTILNAFNPAFSNGSLMDLGLYGLYPMVVLFGRPEKVQAQAVMLDSGVDGEGSLLATYDDMEAVVMHSKIVHSYAPSEIQGERGAMIIPDISEPTSLTLRYNDGHEETIDCTEDYDPMYYETKEFIDLIQKEQKQSTINSHQNSRIVAEIMEEARRQIGLIYPADEK